MVAVGLTTLLSLPSGQLYDAPEQVPLSFVPPPSLPSPLSFRATHTPSSPSEMNYRFRTSGPSVPTISLALVLFCSLPFLSCAATPNTTTTVPTAPTLSAENEPTVKDELTTASSPSPLPSTTPSTIQDVNPTVSPSSSPPTSSDDTPASTISTQSVPSSELVSESVSVASPTVPSPTTTESVSTISTQPATSTSTSSTLESSTSTQTASSSTTISTPEATESSNSTTTTTTSAPKPLISFDPLSGLLISDDNINALLSANNSKLVLKYVNEANDAIQKQKFTFKSTSPSQNGTSGPSFIAKYLVKSLNVSQEKKKDQFADFMPDEIRNRGGVIVHVVLLVYVCLSLGIICDLYFLTSIEYIGNILNLPADIAGATFMALGTSAPELFIALIGVFIAEDDIGTSTILGSAVFNLIFVPSVCGFAIYFSRLKYPKINKYSILRDAIFYIIAITTLMLALKDNEIDWIESSTMLCLYCIYITILYYNAQIGELIEEESDSESDDTSNASETSPLLQSQSSLHGSFTRSEKHALTKSADWESGTMAHGRPRKGSFLSRPSRSNSIRAGPIRNGSIIALPGSGAGYLPIDRLPKKVVKEAIHEEPSGMPENWAESHWALKIAMMPTVLLIKLTVPKPNKSNYFLTFIISILWISAFTYASVWLVTIIGHTLQMPQTVLGLTILAAGSSIPEVISSVIVVKRAGLANMALCNLFGSNIFDILVCLGLPWLIKSVITMVNEGTTDLLSTVVTVQSNGLLFTTFTLMICVISFVVTLGCSGWKLGLSVGVTCFTIYFTAISLATTYELLLN